MMTALPLCLISWQSVVSTLSSPPGFNPKLMSSRTLQAIHLSSVTRATAAELARPVVRHTMPRIVGIALMLLTAADLLIENLSHAHGVRFIWLFADR